MGINTFHNLSLNQMFHFPFHVKKKFPKYELRNMGEEIHKREKTSFEWIIKTSNMNNDNLFHFFRAINKQQGNSKIDYVIHNIDALMFNYVLNYVVIECETLNASWISFFKKNLMIILSSITIQTFSHEKVFLNI